MVTWVNIESTTPQLPPIWLWRHNERDHWRPLRKDDCQKLNKSNGTKPVIIDNSRATADPIEGKITHNFTLRPDRQLISATWFLITNVDGDRRFEDKQKHLIPMSSKDAGLVEAFYKRAMHEASLMGNGLDRLEKEKISLEDDDDYNVVLYRKGSKYSFRKVPKGWFANYVEKSYDIQRGYGDYTLDGEVEEQMLGPVKHVIFVIHGIGEAERSDKSDGISAANSLEVVIQEMRLAMAKQQVDEWVRKCDAAFNQQLPPPARPNRVELVPIYWYGRLRSSSDSLSTSLQATTLSTIPGLRQIANTLMFEVLTYLSPPFCHAVLECVTDQIIDNHKKFKKIHPGYDGSWSLMGHSLGSVICWDLLSILKEKQESHIAGSIQSDYGVQITLDKDSSNVIYNQISANGSSVDETKTSDNDDDGGDGDGGDGNDDDDNDRKIIGSWGPSLPKPIERHLPFTPDFTIFFGSPLGLFLTLRGAHPVFDALAKDVDDDDDDDAREKEVEKIEEKKEDVDKKKSNNSDKKKKKIIKNHHKVSPFSLPSGSIHNVFHPNDPVAYRLEPLLLPHGTDDIPPPVYLTREGKGLRFHVKALHMGENIRKSFTETQKAVSTFVGDKITDPVQRMLGKEPPERPEEEEEEPLRFPLAGLRGTAGRLDFQLQPPVIDSQYLAVAAAHACYFEDTDILDYLIDLTRLSRHRPTIVHSVHTGSNNHGGDETMVGHEDAQEGSTTRTTEDSARIIAV